MRKKLPPEVLQRFGTRLKKYSVEARCRVYFLCHKGEVVYVGQTKHLTRRMNAHFADKQFDSVYYINVWEEDASAVERELITAFRPHYNRVNGIAGFFAADPRRELPKASEYYSRQRRPNQKRPEPTWQELNAAMGITYQSPSEEQNVLGSIRDE